MRFEVLKKQILDDVKNKEHIEIKKYLPLIDKKMFVDDVVQKCIIDNGGIKKIDYILKIMQIDIGFITNYTNIDLTEVDDMLEVYDFLKEYAVIDYVFEQIPCNERTQIYELIELETKQQLQLDNSPILHLMKSIYNLVEKLPQINDKQVVKLVKDLTKSHPELLDSFNRIIQQTTINK